MDKSEPNPQNSVLKFITLEGNPSHAAHDATFRRLVKSNARRSRSVLKAGSEPDSRVLQSDGAAIPVSAEVTLKHRFALDSRKPLKRKSRRKIVARLGDEFESLESRTWTSGLTGPASQPEFRKDILGNRSKSSCGPPGNAIVPSSCYSSTILSGKTKEKVETMSHYFFAQVISVPPAKFATHLLSNFNALLDLNSLSNIDQAIFQATLSIVSVYYDTGAPDIFHCQQTLRIVSRRLGNTALQSSNETIGAVALLIIHNILVGTKEDASLHMNGLQQMVLTRGGLEYLPTKLRKTLSMIDLFHATTFHTTPHFPHPNLSPDDYHTLRTYHTSCPATRRTSILTYLHRLTLVRFSDPLAVFLALSDAIYTLEYQLVTIPPSCSNKNSRLNGNDDGFIRTKMTTVEREEASEDPFRTAVFLYIDKVLRDMPPLNLAPLTARLIVALTQFQSQNQLDTLPNSTVPANAFSSPYPILWILFIGIVTCPKNAVEERVFFLERLARSCNELSLQSMAVFETCLENIGPVVQAFGRDIGEVWRDIEMRLCR